MKSAPAKAKKPDKRVRRSAEDAREAILDATERRLVAAGPAGIRIQDVAADVGVSHPTILHHFGSREHLVQAVACRRLEAMHRDVISALSGTDASASSVSDLYERLYAIFGPGGHARVAAFFALEGRPAGAEPLSIEPIVAATHAARLARASATAATPDYEDTYFTVLLSALTLFGEAIVGPLFRGEPDGQRDEAVSKRFREWCVHRLFEILRRGTTMKAEPESPALGKTRKPKR